MGRYYYLTTLRPYSEKKGFFKFKLINRGELLVYLKTLDGTDWQLCSKESIAKYRKYKTRFSAITSAGIYAITITDTRNNITDIAYIGCATDVHARLSSHATLSFLLRKLIPSHTVDVYCLSVKRGWQRSKEKEAITKFQPFLNKPEPKRVAITL